MDSKIRFSKMHGLSNDVVIIETLQQSFTPAKELIAQLAKRHTGIGFDQLLVIKKSTKENIDFIYSIYNANGSQAEQCGNGVRCIAKFLKAKGFTNKSELRLQTEQGKTITTQLMDDKVKVNMGAAIFKSKPSELTTLDVDDQTIAFATVSMGNPHAVIHVDDLNNSNIENIADCFSTSDYFPNGTNIEFMQIINPNEIQLRVFERGTGETQACGSGACAAAVIAKAWGLIKTPVTVHQAGGDLIIDVDESSQDIYMTGAACFVFDGIVDAFNHFKDASYL